MLLLTLHLSRIERGYSRTSYTNPQPHSSINISDIVQPLHTQNSTSELRAFGTILLSKPNVAADSHTPYHRQARQARLDRLECRLVALTRSSLRSGKGFPFGWVPTGVDTALLDLAAVSPPLRAVTLMSRLLGPGTLYAARCAIAKLVSTITSSGAFILQRRGASIYEDALSSKTAYS